MIKEHLSKATATLEATPEKVWEALTKPEIVKQYFFGANQQSTYKKGDPITWDGEFQGQRYLDKGVILKSDPPHELEYSYLSSWSGKEDKPENYLWVKYELAAVAGGTQLTITSSNYDAERAADSGGNWSMVIDGLRKVVEV